MLNHKILATVCTAVALQLLAGVAYATTFSAQVTPPKAGTAQSPRAHTTTLTLSKIDQGVDGNAKSGLTTLAESLPADFVTTLGSFATCSPSLVVHGDNKPKCPDASLLGHVSGTAYAPAFHFDTTTDQGYIWKIGATRVGMWVHVSHPIPAGLAAYATISRGATPFGPVVTWDLTSWANGAQASTEIRVNNVTFSWEPGGSGQQSPSSAASSRQRRACLAKARKIKNSRRRKAAEKRCGHTNAKPKGPSTTASAPFVSTGCTSGSWAFQAQLTFFADPSETVNTSVACSPNAGASSSQPPPPPPPSPGPTAVLCPPVCTMNARGHTAPGSAATTQGSAPDLAVR
jgi:hypothetical protein